MKCVYFYEIQNCKYSKNIPIVYYVLKIKIIVIQGLWIHGHWMHLLLF